MLPPMPFSNETSAVVTPFTTEDYDCETLSATVASASSHGKFPMSRNLKTISKRCNYCALSSHRESERCPAKGATCHYCKKLGHFKAACYRLASHERKRVNATSINAVEVDGESSEGNDHIFQNSKISCVSVIIFDYQTEALVDSGCFENLIDENFFNKLSRNNNIEVKSISPILSHMAHMKSTVTLTKYIKCDITVKGNVYADLRLIIMPHAVHDLILGEPFFKMHRSVVFRTNGNLPCFQVGHLSPIKPISQVSPFANMEDKLTPISVRSRRYSDRDVDFIRSEVRKLLDNKIISPSCSPWRAQVLVASRDTKPRMVIDYSQTINRYTFPDAYPTPKIDQLVNDIASNKYFTKIDLSSAYHQLPLLEADKKIYGL